jgi:hypothetical protein
LAPDFVFYVEMGEQAVEAAREPPVGFACEQHQACTRTVRTISASVFVALFGTEEHLLVKEGVAHSCDTPIWLEQAPVATGSTSPAPSGSSWGQLLGTQVARGLSDPRLGRLPTSSEVGHVDDTTLAKARLT